MIDQQPEPEAPTRDEIREACEAVGWNWNERQKPRDEETRYDHFDFAIAPDRTHFHPTRPNACDADALALLEAWRMKDLEGRWYQVDSPCGGGKAFGVDLVDGDESFEAWGDTLPAAAVRAALQWARSKR